MYLKLSLFFFLLINISGYVSYSQNEVYQSIKELELSDTAKAFKIDSLLISNVENGDSLNASIVSSRFANWHYNRNRVAQAVAALSFSIQYHTQDTLSLAEKWYRKGYFNLRQGDYYSSIYDFEKVIKIAPNTQRGILAYVQKADALYTIGDFELAATQLEIAEKALLDKKDYKSLIYLYTLSYNTYSELQTEPASKKLLRNLKTADSLSTTLNINNVYEILDIKVALGKYYIEYSQRDIPKGEYYLKQALAIAQEIPDSNRVADIYVDLGRLYDEENPKKSIAFQTKALAYCSENNDYLKSIIKANIGINNAHLEDYSNALNNLKEALFLITGERIEELSHINKKAHIKENIKNDNFWVILRSIAETYGKSARERNISNKAIDSAQTYYKLTDIAFEEYLNVSTLQNSKFLWRKQSAELYSRALKSAFAKNDAQYALELMEKNKALILSEELHKIKSLKQENVPSNLLLNERKLQFEISQLNKNNKAKPSQLEVLIDSLESIKIQLKPLLNSNNILIEPSKIVDLKTIQSNLLEDEAIIEYHIAIDDGFGIYPNPNTGYGLFISKYSHHFFELENLNLLKKKIETLTTLNETPFTKREDITKYRDLSHSIYTSLFPDFLLEELTGKSLIIIPDYYLTQIPFESLIVSTSSEKEDYLIYHNPVSYKYSYSFHEANKVTSNSNKQDFLAYAPISYPSQNLPDLSSSIQELDAISHYFNGELKTDHNATVISFKENAGNSRIIHLATHANASDSIIPWISFKENKISLNEISLIETNADLVVLSACNTTKGETLPGEGVMSLARGFFYGGTQSTISSLWQVNDKATTYIMDSFYKNLADGNTKSLALHKAKLEYLDNHNGSELSPYYWSSFILIGDSTPIDRENFLWHYILGIVGVLFVTVLIMLSRKRKTTH